MLYNDETLKTRRETRWVDAINRLNRAVLNYSNRVADLEAELQRCESDIAALSRPTVIELKLIDRIEEIAHEVGVIDPSSNPLELADQCLAAVMGGYGAEDSGGE